MDYATTGTVLICSGISVLSLYYYDLLRTMYNNETLNNYNLTIKLAKMSKKFKKTIHNFKKREKKLRLTISKLASLDTKSLAINRTFSQNKDLSLNQDYVPNILLDESNNNTQMEHAEVNETDKTDETNEVVAE